MKNMSRRDRQLSLILPTIFIVLGYTLWQLRNPVRLSIIQLTKAIATENQQAPSSEQLAQAQAAQDRATKSIAELRQQNIHLTNAIWLESGAGVSVAERGRAMQGFLRILQNNQLTLLEQLPASDEILKSLPSGMANLVASAKASAVGGEGITWSTRVAGNYESMVSALDELAKSGLDVIPLTLSMDPALPGNTLRVWKLFVWL